MQIVASSPQKGTMQLKNMTMKMVMVVIIIINCISTIVVAGDKTELVRALGMVESSGDNYVIGDTNLVDKAYGYLQVRKDCLADVNEWCGTNVKLTDLLGDRARSIWVFEKYMERYATKKRLKREPTYEDMVRIWNGGPNGWRDPDTKFHWVKVEREMRRTKARPVVIVKSVEIGRPTQELAQKASNKIKLDEKHLILVAKK